MLELQAAGYRRKRASRRPAIDILILAATSLTFSLLLLRFAACAAANAALALGFTQLDAGLYLL